MTGRDLPPHEQGSLVPASQFPWTSHSDNATPLAGRGGGRVAAPPSAWGPACRWRSVSAGRLTDLSEVKTPSTCLAACHGHRLSELLHPSQAGRAAQSQPGRRPRPRPLPPVAGWGTQNTHIFNTERIPLIAEAVLEWLARVAVHAGFLRWNRPCGAVFCLTPCGAGEGSGLLDGASEQSWGKVMWRGVPPAKSTAAQGCDPLVCRGRVGGAGRAGEPAARLRGAPAPRVWGLRFQRGSWKPARNLL